jgi:hypothetical protein
MYGVVNGVYYCNNERVDELNDRISERNLPSDKLQIVFDPRPQTTRRMMYPAFHTQSLDVTTPIEIQKPFNPFTQFNPGSSAPFSGYATNIDQESRMKNIFMPKQKYTGQTQFVPSTKSDLYNMNHLKSARNDSKQQQVQIPHNELFRETEFSPFNPNDCNIGNDLFNNHTRVQTRNIGRQQ